MATSIREVERTGRSYKFGVTGEPLLESGNCVATSAGKVPEKLPAKLRASIVSLFKDGLLEIFQVAENGRRIELTPSNMSPEGRMAFATELAKLSGKRLRRQPPDINHVPSSLVESLKRLLK